MREKFEEIRKSWLFLYKSMIGSIVMGSIVMGSIVVGSIVMDPIVMGSIVMGSIVMRENSPAQTPAR